MIKVAILNSGDNTGLNFTRSLVLAGRYETVGIDFHLDDYHTSETDTRLLLAGDDTSTLIPFVNSIVRTHGVDLVYVADTGPALLAIAANRDKLDAITLLPDQPDLLCAEDKWLTYLRLHEHDLSVPETILVESAADLAGFFARHSEVWIRRRTGSGGRGALGTDSHSLALAWIDSTNGWGDFTAAEQLSERTATFSGLWHGGNLVASQLRERLGWKYSARSPSGVTGITGAQRTLWDADLHETAIRAVQAVAPNATGAFGVDFTYDDSGRQHITEVQPARFYSSIYFLARAGINLPDLYCQLAVHGMSEVERTINPVRQPIYWVKSVDKTPQLLSEQEYLVDRS